MGMKIVTVNIPDQYLDYIQKMIEEKKLPSRSEGVRQALGDFLKNEPVFTEELACVSLQ